MDERLTELGWPLSQKDQGMTLRQLGAMTSGYARSEQSARLMKEGAKGLVHKPYKSEVLLRSIRNAIDGIVES